MFFSHVPYNQNQYFRDNLPKQNTHILRANIYFKLKKNYKIQENY